MELFVFIAMLGSTVDPGDDFVKMFVFSALLGSTLVLQCSSRCVLFPGRQVQDARHLGRCGPEE